MHQKIEEKTYAEKEEEARAFYRGWDDFRSGRPQVPPMLSEPLFRRRYFEGWDAAKGR